ncbi:MAG: hypothetical protein JO141_09725 [Bradyrhizobium sp.]|nr:hypothetical protein [Bradyrhizobium sp.]
MAEDDPPDEISQIEADVEELAKVAESCRKFILGSKAAIASGVALLLVAMFGLFGAGLCAFLGSIALMLGGVVTLGSNVSTLRQTEAAISAAEALRSDLIGRIDLREVRDAPVKLM